MKRSFLRRTIPQLSLSFLAIAPFAKAVDIVLVYDNANSDEPVEDSDGSKLTAIMEAAEEYWEDIIKGPQVLTITYHYDTSSPSNGQFYNSTENNSFVTSGKIRFRPNPTLGWWWDPTPLDNSEYNLGETLVRDMAPAVRDAMFAPGAPRLLEALYWGTPAEGAPDDAVNKRDMFTYAIHEMGHALGMTGNLTTTAAEIADNDYDLDPLLLNGANASTLLDPGGGSHIECNGCLMNTNVGPSLRKLPSAADVLSIATCPDIDGVLNTNQGWLVIDLPRKEFLPGGSLNWNIAGNWIGARLPDSDDRANIRLSSEMNGDHSVFLSNNGVCRELFLSGSNGLSTGSNRLDIAEAGFLVHDGTLPRPRALVQPGGELEANKLTVSGA
ncbi:hypothetical protein N9A86_06060, partial [Akkermansiaceae bacterium]|nr:hypothetical protein [Akkermansiaceae bacterium]